MVRADLRTAFATLERGDHKTALREYTVLAEEGDPRAQFELGGMYYKGEGVPRDYVQAMKWYREAAEQGHARAQFNLGYMYAKGEGVPRDYVQAMKWSRKAAEQGDASAQFNLGVMYEQSEGVPQDYAQAAKWYRKAAEQGHARAQYNLGYKYAKGEGVPQDYVQAMKWSRKAAEQGDARAQLNLGTMYFEGRGLPQDYAQAAKWYREAAEQGHARAQLNLGVMYAKGEGVPQDYVQAMKWSRKAAEQGLPGAQLNLGVMYAKGEGVPQDYIKAYAWANLAAAQGNEKARSNRDRMAPGMNPYQIAEAQRLSRKFAAQVSAVESVAQSLEHVELPAQSSQAVAATRESQPPKRVGSGSGFLVSASGHVVTNHHVVDECGEIRIPLSGQATNALVVAVDELADLALLKIPATPNAIAKFRDARRARLGEAVLVAGYLLRGVLTEDLNVSTGAVSALAGPHDDARLLQISAPVQAGNSGGPLLDNSGNVMGVVVSKLDAVRVLQATGDIPQNVNFSIKGTVARSFLDIHGVDYELARSEQALDNADIAEKARKFTVMLECWK